MLAMPSGHLAPFAEALNGSGSVTASNPMLAKSTATGDGHRIRVFMQTIDLIFSIAHAARKSKYRATLASIIDTGLRRARMEKHAAG